VKPVAVIDGRTGLEMLSAPECWRLLEGTRVGRVAVTVEGSPEVMPVNYVVFEGTIVFRTDSGTKHRALDHDPAVAFEVDDFDAESRTGWSVQVKGRAHVVHDPPVLRRLRSTALLPWAGGDKALWIRITPIAVTGRRIRRAS
jgi:uncharacterized protein